MEAKAQLNCTQCNTQLIGNYCHHCGQQHTGQKASLLLLLREGLGTFFSLERSGLATLLGLVKNPKHIVINYLEGNRGFYQPPNKLIFYALIVFGLHLSLVDNEVLNLSFDVEGISPSLFFMILVIPLLSLAGWLLYGPRKHRFADHLVMNSYIVPVWYMLLTLFGDLLDLIYQRDWDFVDFLLFLVITPLYTGFVFQPEKSRIRQIGMALLHLLLYFSIIAAITGIIYLLGGRVRSTTV